MPRLAFVMVLLVAVAACTVRNPEFCPNGATANGAACIDAPPGMGDHCTATSGCMADPMFPLCDTTKNSGTCVQCTKDKHDACQGMTPHCDMDTELCVACVDDGDCGGSGVCLPTGGCADPATIIHAISMNGSTNTTTCGGMGAGNACTLETALAIATSGKNVIKLDDPGPYVAMMNNFTVDTDIAIGLTVDARNATLHHNANGAIITINSSKGLTILGGAIEGATASGGSGIRCNDAAALTVRETVIRLNDESGIKATGCTLTVTNASIHDNGKGGLFAGITASDGAITISRSQIISNRGGGVFATGSVTFVIVGNVFLNNGDTAGVVGGLSATTTMPGNRLEFNTIAQNKSQPSVGPGIQCTATPGFTAQNNIVWSNNGSVAQVGGGCLHAYSDVGPISIIGTSAFDAGNNISTDPKFNDATMDLSLTSMTPVRGKANPQADLTDIASRDIAGKLRVTPADIGAYQAPPLP